MQAPTDRHVIVLGAGLAGLSAAQRLVEGHRKVTVIEAQHRVGGRAFSLPHPFAAGLVAETGPARFPPDFLRVISLAQRHGLELEPFYPESGSIVGLLEGRRMVGFVPDSEQFWGYGERSSFMRGLLQRLRGRLPQRMYHLRGGTHQLPIAMASVLEAEILLGCQAIAIEQSADRVVVRYRTAIGEATLEAGHLVCALPLSALQTLTWGPELPLEKARLIESIPWMPAVRVFFQMSEPFWLQDGLNGFAFTDTIGEVWAPDFASPGEPTLLVCYAHRDLADRLCAMDEGQRIDHVLGELEKVFPGARTHVQDSATHSWSDAEWIDGAWPMVRHGFRRQVPILQAPHGRVFFAGDYATSPRFLNMMEGALDAGERAGQQLLAC